MLHLSHIETCRELNGASINTAFVKVGEKTLFILPSLEPVGFYKIYDLGRLMHPNGRIFLRITIESGDGSNETLPGSIQRKQPKAFAHFPSTRTRRQV